MTAGPGQLFGLGPIGQAQVAKPEGGKGVVFEFEGIVPSFLETLGTGGIVPGAIGVIRCQDALALLADAVVGVAQIAQHQGLPLLGLRHIPRHGARSQDIKYQHAEVTGDGPAAFTHQGGHGHVVGFAAFAHGGDHVVGVVLQGVVGGRGRGGAAAVVVDAQAPADIEKAHGRPEPRQFDIDLPRFLERVFEYSDVVDLAADMEVQQAQIGQQARLAQGGNGAEDIGNREAELGPFAHRTAPTAGAAG